MAKTDDTRPDDPQPKNANGLTRRDFVKTGAAAGLGAGALLAPDQADAQVEVSARATSGRACSWSIRTSTPAAGCYTAARFSRSAEATRSNVGT